MTPRCWTPNQLRSTNRKLLKDTAIKITEFQWMLSVSSNTYKRFMNGRYKNQWDAAENGTYDSATRSFIKEERLGAQAIGKLSAQGRKKEGTSAALPDICGIETDGLTWLTPGETRREIANILKTYKTTVTALARLADVPVQSFNLFYNAGGNFGALQNQAYRPAAKLVEKIRTACGCTESMKRLGLDAEVAFGHRKRNGKPFLGVSPNGKMLCLAGEKPTLSRDALGCQIIEYWK